MRRRLWIFCGITAVLSVIACFDGILVIAAFFAVVPAIILGFAPEAFLVSATLLLVDPLPRGATIVALGALPVALVAASAGFNRPLNQEVRRLTRGDHDLEAPLSTTRNLAIRIVATERTRRVSCETLCLLLLYNHVADSVLVSIGVDTTLDPAEIGTQFHLERQRPCPKADLRTDDMSRPPYALVPPAGADLAQLVSARMAGGECLIAEPARVSDAPVVVEINPHVLPLHNESNVPAARNARHLLLAPQRAPRISIYVVQDSGFDEVFRETEVDGFPLVPVLLMGPIFTGEGGIGIVEGFYRQKRVYSAYTLLNVLNTKLGLDVGQWISRTGTKASPRSF